MPNSQLITLLTDLGTTDAYVGIVKGILHSRAPDARVIDLTHAAESGSLYTTAYLLAAAFPYFPAGTVHLVLTNPSSSPEGKILAAQVDSQYLVAPDDGVTSLIFDEHPPANMVSVENDAFLLPARRHTFHSRLIYAPVAAAIVAGTSLKELGPTLSQSTRLPHATASREPDGSIQGEVVHIDHFGNLVTNIRATQLPPPPFRIMVGDAIIDHVSDSYSDVESGHVLAIIGTTGNLEISVNRANAAKRLFVSLFQHVHVHP